MFSASVGITMGMIHGGNSTSYWFASCLHLGNMWPHNTALSGPSLSNQPLFKTLLCWRLHTEDQWMQQDGKEERPQRRKKNVYLLLLIFPGLHTLVNKWCAARRGFFHNEHWRPWTSPECTREAGGPRPGSHFSQMDFCSCGLSPDLQMHKWCKTATR